MLRDPGLVRFGSLGARVILTALLIGVDPEEVGRDQRLCMSHPDPESRLPYMIWLPIDSGLVLKARETWPRASRFFCAQDATPWNESGGVLDDVPVVLCRRRGAAIDQVLDRASLLHSQFVFPQDVGGPRSGGKRRRRPKRLTQGPGFHAAGWREH